MKLSSPLAALSLSFVTWFWFDKREERQRGTFATNFDTSAMLGFNVSEKVFGQTSISIPTKRATRRPKGRGRATRTPSQHEMLDKLAMLHSEMEKRETRITELETALHVSSATQVQAESDMRDKIASLQSEINLRETRIAELEAAVPVSPVIQEQAGDVDRIASLQSEIKKQKKQIAKLESAAKVQTAAQTKIDSLQFEVKKQEKHIAELEVEIEKKNIHIAKLDATECVCDVQTLCAATFLDNDASEEMSVGKAIHFDVAANNTDSNTDSVQDVLEASVQSMALLWDALAYVADTVTAQIWPWPMDSATSLPRFDPGSVAVEFLENVWNATMELPGLLPSELTAFLPLEMLEEIKGGAYDMVDVCINATRPKLDMMIESFLQHHPEHKANIGGRDPGLVMLLLAGLLYLALYELYGLAKAVCGLLRIMWWIICLPCHCCCRRRKSVTVPATSAPVDNKLVQPSTSPSASPSTSPQGSPKKPKGKKNPK